MTPLPSTRPASPGAPRTPEAPSPESFFDPNQSPIANRLKPLATTPPSPHARVPASAPDATGPFLDRKKSLYLAPETLKGTDVLPTPPKDQKTSNFIELYKNRSVDVDPIQT